MSTNSACGDPSIFGTNPGDYLTAGTGIVFSSGPTWGSIELDLPENKDFKELKSRMEEIEKRLAIVVPNKDLQARFPALQEAYDHYKLIEKLVNDQGSIP